MAVRHQWPGDRGPAYGLALVYACDSKGNVFALTADGPPKSWEKNYGGVVSGTPQIYGYTLYVASAASAASQIYAVSAYTGNQLWHYPTSGQVNSGLATDGVTVYAGDEDGYLYAIDIASITVRWSHRVGGPVRSQILLANGVVYFGSLDHHVYALRA